VIVGSGPNGLAAAITLAEAGRSVVVLEAKDHIGGGMRSAELTLPGFTHDVCSAIHPLLAGSPFFEKLNLEPYGMKLVHPEVPFAHPLEGGRAGVLYRSVDETAEALGPDADAYRRLVAPLVKDYPKLRADLFGPLRLTPQHPFTMARYGRFLLTPVTRLTKRFKTDEAAALFAGMGSHTMLPLDAPMTGAFALFFAILGHAVGWPAIAGGSQRLADAMASYLRSLGGDIRISRPVTSLRDLPPHRCVLLDVSPRQLLDIAGEKLSPRFRRQAKRFRYGPGTFKVDWALSEPIPWTAPEVSRAGTVHVVGTLAEAAASEASVNASRQSDKPFVLLAQQSIFDPSRAPKGQHTAWGYCHVPSGSTVDMTEAIENQIERFAPGFRDVVLAKHTIGPSELQEYNPNYIGGDIGSGVVDLRQSFTRPSTRWNPYTTSAKDIFICSSSTPPGPGVHGMCGMLAAKTCLKTELSSDKLAVRGEPYPQQAPTAKLESEGAP
jgi:phytoene dehydrogenase-like protein